MSKSLQLEVLDGAESQLKERRIWNTCEYIWIITDYDYFINKPVGHVAYSPDFQAIADKTCPVKWRLAIYPSGWDEKSKDLDLTILYINLKAASKLPVHMKCDLFFQNSDNEVIKSVCFENSFTEPYGYSYGRILKRNLLTESLLDNILQIRAYVCYSVNKLESYQKIDPDPKFLKFANAWNSILENPKLSDILLIAEGEEIKAHKIILSSRSPVFMAMFSYDSVENESGKIEISDFNANTVRALLRFIYTNDIKIRDTDEAMSLVRAAEKYDISDLKQLCSDYLKRKITVRNAEDMLLFADIHNVSELKQCAMKYISDNPKKFLNLDRFKKLAQNPNLFAELFSKTLMKLAIE